MTEDFLKWIHGDSLEEFKIPVAGQRYYKFPNTYSFISNDEKERFESIKTDSELEYYIENPIKYKLNSEGFRMNEEFEDNISVNIFLGCSDTFGYGLHQEHTWSYKLHNYISKGEKYWNLALPGNGVQTDFRTLYYILNKYGKNIKVSNVFHLIGYRLRFELFDNEGPYMTTIHDYKDGYSNKIKRDLLYKTNNKIWHLSNLNAIENIISKYNSNYYVTSIDYLVDTHMNTQNNFNVLFDESLRHLKARDLQHPSYSTNHEIFSVFLDMYNSKLENKIL